MGSLWRRRNGTRAKKPHMEDCFLSDAVSKRCGKDKMTVTESGSATSKARTWKAGTSGDRLFQGLTLLVEARDCICLSNVIKLYI